MMNIFYNFLMFLSKLLSVDKESGVNGLAVSAADGHIPVCYASMEVDN